MSDINLHDDSHHQDWVGGEEHFLASDEAEQVGAKGGTLKFTNGSEISVGPPSSDPLQGSINSMRDAIERRARPRALHGAGVSIADRINAAYRAHLAGEAAKRGSWWPRASGCGGCLREMAHLLSGCEPRPTSPESERVFELGHQRGARLAQVARTIWPDAVCELEVEIPIPGVDRLMRGHLDLWIPSERLIVDFKTAGGFKMGLLVTGAEAAGEDYEMQVQAYRHGISWRIGSSVFDEEEAVLRSIKCLLVFEAKDSDARKGVTAGQLVEVEVPHTEELEARFQARMKALGEMLTAANSGTLDPKAIPGMPDPKKHWRCKVKDGRPLYCSIGPTVGQCG